MGKGRETCVGCNGKFPLTELHIKPETSEWYCDPCYNVMMLEVLGNEDVPEGPNQDYWESYNDENNDD